MAGSIKGLTVEIGGDTTKLGKALEGVNKKSRDLSGELGQINKLLKLDPGNADLLTQKQKVLAEAVSNTSEKLQKLKHAEKQVQEQFKRGEVSEDQVRALQREIVATEQKMGQYERAAEETERALRGVGKESDNVTKSSGKMGAALANAAKVGLTAVAAAAGAAVAALAGATVEAAAYADDMLTMSTVTGMSTDNLQAFNYAAGLLDVEVETITKSLAKNTKSMASAADGSKAYADAYEQLGVSVTDSNGNLRDSETVYWEAIDALGQMSNETERDALAMQLFGKSAQELNPLIEAGSEAVNGLKEEAKEVGAVMSEDTLAALGSFDDSVQRLKGSAGAAKNSLGGVLLPELQMLTDAGTGLLTDFTQKLNASGGGLEGLVSTVSDMAPQITGVLTDMATQLLSSISAILPTLVTVAVQLITSLTTSIISMLPQLVTTGIDVLLALIQGITQAIPQLTQAIVGMIPQLTQALVTGIPQLIQAGVELLLALVKAIPQILPPLIDALPQIILAIVNGLISATPQLIEASILLLMALVKAIPHIVVALGQALPQILWAIMEGIADIPSIIWNVLQNVFPGVATWVRNMASKAVEMGSKFISSVVSFFQQLPGKIGAFLTSVIGRVSTWATNLAAKGRAAAKSLLDSVVNGIKSLPGKVLSVGSDLVTGLWNGINNKLTWLKNKISSFTSSVLDGIKSFFGVNSPSRETMWIGDMLDQGLAEGIVDGAKAPMRAMQRVSAGVLDAAAGDVGGLSFERSLSRPRTSAVAMTAMTDNSMLGKLDQILQAIERGQILTIDRKTLIGATATDYDNTLGQRRALAARGAL